MTATEINQATPAYVIFGATGGIGSVLCEKLHASGAKFLLAGRDESKLAALAECFDAKYFVLDARNFEQVDRCIEAGVAAYGHLDGAVNCVGSILLKPAHSTSEQEFSDIIATNLSTAFACVRSTAKVMRERGGSIVLVSSAAARIGLANHEAIAAAKAGIIGLMFASATSYARHRIRVNCVAPGLVETKLTERITNNEASRQASVALHPLGSLGKPSDIASAIAWLLSSQSEWVTGQVLSVDGGLSTLKAPVSTARPGR